MTPPPVDARVVGECMEGVRRRELEVVENGGGDRGRAEKGSGRRSGNWGRTEGRWGDVGRSHGRAPRRGRRNEERGEEPWAGGFACGKRAGWETPGKGSPSGTGGRTRSDSPWTERRGGAGKRRVRHVADGRARKRSRSGNEVQSSREAQRSFIAEEVE